MFEPSCNMDESLKIKVQELIDSGLGDTGRLEHIMDYIVKDKPLFKSDLKYLENMHKFLLDKIQKLEHESKSLKPNHVTLSEPKPSSGRKPLLADEDLDRILDEQEKRKQKNLAPRTESSQTEQNKQKTSKLKQFFQKKKTERTSSS